MTAPEHTRTWPPPLVVGVAVLAAAAAALAYRMQVLPLPTPMLLAAVGVASAVATALASLPAEHHPKVWLWRAAALVAAGGWSTWAAWAGFGGAVWVGMAIWAAPLAGLGYLCRPAPPAAQSQPAVEPDAPGDLRPNVVRRWEALLRRLTAGKGVVVTSVVPWDNPRDGHRVWIDLPEGMKARDLDDVLETAAAACRLPAGCNIQRIPGRHQGEVGLDVMTRDCLADVVTVEEDFTPASVNDEFTVMTTPKGEPIDMCLRVHSMVIGGMPDSGKTTLLHRIILWLARCVDAVIWVVDTNGGGLATPWIRAWAMGNASRPIIDWVAADEEEALVLVAFATAIAKDRKTSPEAVRRRHGANTTLLPVDEKLPAVVVLNDEGGEMRQAVSLIGQLADQGLSRLAQIGRAEAVRVIKSVLRGTADLLDKSLRVCAPLRIALQMSEEDEYPHVLGAWPGKVDLLHKGSGFGHWPGNIKPRLARTVNVELDQIERASIVCADLRPGDESGQIDERAKKVCARQRVRDVFGGRDQDPEVMNLPVMRDVEAGLGYARRWERFAPRLAAIRGEEPPEDDDPPQSAPPAPPPPPPTPPAADPIGGGPLAALRAAAGLAPVGEPAADPVAVHPSRIDLDDATVYAEAARLLAGIDWSAEASADVHPAPAGRVERKTTEQHILEILAEAAPAALSSNQIGARLNDRQASVSRGHRQKVLAEMLTAGKIAQTRKNGPYRLAGS